MVKILRALDRGQVTTFSRNTYEVVFSIFMIALAWFYRDNPEVVYPQILYCFLLLLGSNFVFNSLLRRRASVNLWLVDLILLVNFWTITGVLLYSGGGRSYFWVLYLLPVFAAALMAKLKDAAGMALLCIMALAALNWPITFGDLASLLGLAVKGAVLGFSAWVVYNTAQSRRVAEAGLAFKREQVEALAREISEQEVALVRTASEGEVGRLVGGVMHDLGNSISVILLSAEILSQENPEKKETQLIAKAARFARALISSAFAIVRGQEYTFEQVSLAEVADSASLLTDYAARKKGATVEQAFPENLAQVRGSRPHLERMLVNTVFNALSFVSEGGKVSLTARNDGDSVEISICDNGPGFPEQLLKEGVKAFGSTRRQEGGTGLGLFVCDQIARRHGGSMQLTNSADGGACVKVTLPVTGPAV